METSWPSFWKCKQLFGSFVVAFILSSPLVQGAAQEAESAGFMKLEDVGISRTLEIYKDYSGLELIVASNVDEAIGTITVQSDSDPTTNALVRLLEKALLDQASVVITPLDGKRASVTFNEALANARALATTSINSPEDTDGSPFGIVIVALLGFLGAAFAFWLWMLVDCASNETERVPRVAWMLAIIFAGFICAPLYFLVRKLSR